MSIELQHLIYVGYAESACCTEKFMDFDLIKYTAKTVEINKHEDILNNETRILQEYQFICSSSITYVIVGDLFRTQNNNHQLFLSVQIWRSQGL